MTIRRKDFITEVLTDTDLENVQDNGNIEVSSSGELSSLPASVNTAYVKADESIYIRRSGGWIKLAKEISVNAGYGLTGGGSLNADRTISLDTGTTDGRYAGKAVETTVSNLTGAVNGKLDTGRLFFASVHIGANSEYIVGYAGSGFNICVATWSTSATPLISPSCENLTDGRFRIRNGNGTAYWCHFVMVK